MSFRFWRRIKILPGVTLNLSKSGGSLSFGPRGAKVTVGTRGRRATAGIPGSGLFYTSRLPGRESHRGGSASSAVPAAPGVRPEDRLSLGFFDRLVMPADEETFVDGCREFIMENEEKALEQFEKAAHLADGAFLAGFLALKKGRFEEAAGHLSAAAGNPDRLGRYFSKYGISLVMSLPITAELSAHIDSDLRGVLLGLVEVYQRLGRREEAIACLERLRRLEADDVVVKLSLAELLLDRPVRLRPGDRPARGIPRSDKNVCRKVVRLAEGVGNESPVHTALLLYKARALRRLGLLDAARETLTRSLRRKKGRSQDLRNALRYERALVYERLGQHRRERSDLERLFAEAPDYEDVADRLGLADNPPQGGEAG